MTLKLYSHPLSSFCQKVLIALYENGTPFEAKMVNFGDEASRSEFVSVWPMAKIPVLVDGKRDQVVPETSIIIEYLDQHYPGRCRLIAADPDLARQTRLRDRFFDLYVHMQMQKIVGDRLRPEDKRDLFGVAEARRLLSTALELIDESMAGKEWAMGEDFTMADCAAAPALWYANEAQPFADTHPNTFDYLERLKARPSFSRALREAEPYLHLFPR
ncbi:MAG: glutathione S-transferase family protein [Alphaproteobacteria bacterium]|nr:glutathione S-transferase family protein [Alphaproteobacteria bacterium]